MKKQLPKSVIIIGAGIGGLATACLLANKGVAVTIIEKNEQVGGRAGFLEVDGFKSDTGPSWFLMPDVFEHFFDSIGVDMNQALDLKRLDPAYKVFFESNLDPITIYGDEDKDSELFESIEPGAGKSLKKYLKSAEIAYKSATESFLYTNFDNYPAFMTPKSIKALPIIAKSASQSIDNYVSKFVTNPQLKQVLEYPMVFLGTSPYEAPSLFRLMSYMDFCQGVYYPMGGMYQIIEVLNKFASDNSVVTRLSVGVDKIITKNKLATGVRLINGEIIEADVIISNADVYHTEMKLLAPKDRSYSQADFDKQTASPSAILVYLGVSGKLPQLIHHNLLFTNDWKKNFGDIFNAKKWPVPASMYVCKPSQTDDSVAPSDHENIFILIPIPSGDSQIDNKELDKRVDIYLDQFAEQSKIKDLKKRIVFKKIFGPDDFGTNFNSWENSMLGPAHVLSQSALWRNKNISKKLSNLYYVGATTTPGIGLPMCLISAELVYKRLIGDKSIKPLKVSRAGK